MDNNQTTPDISGILSKLTADPSMMQQISQLADTLKGNNGQGDSGSEPPQTADSLNFNIDNHTNLFHALKPYLNDERRSALDNILQLFNIIKLAEMSGLNLGNLFPNMNINKSNSENN